MSSNSQPTTGRRYGSTLVALVVGTALAAGFLGLCFHGPLRNSKVYRYVEHPVQWAEVLFFCCGLGALLTKVMQLRQEHVALEDDILPRWDGKPTSVDRASELLGSIERQPGRIQNTILGRRLRSIVEFLCQRRSADALDEHIRSTSETDLMTQENSFALIRFITWAIPILGFLGTVLGITDAISGIRPEDLDESVSMITGGLAEAFDSTALGLGLTMILMFLTFLMERQEQSLLDQIDRLVERQLAHRFLRHGLDSAPLLDAVRQSTTLMTQAVEGLVQRQADVWANALQAPERQYNEQMQEMHKQFTISLCTAMDQTTEAYAQRLGKLEQQSIQQSAHLMQQLLAIAESMRSADQKQLEALQNLVVGLSSQAMMLSKLHEDSTQVIALQSVLQQNLNQLAGANAFEEAVHSLTAAVHLLTARAGGSPLRISRDKAA